MPSLLNMGNNSVFFENPEFTFNMDKLEFCEEDNICVSIGST